MVAANRRQRQKEETKKIIQETAYSLFEEKGYEGTTMRDLSRQAGVGIGTIFTHFPDKPSLLAAAFLEDLNGIIDQAFTSLPKKYIIIQLEHIVLAVYGFYGKRPNFSKTLIKELFFLQGTHGEKLETQLITFLTHIGQLFQNAKLRCEISEDLDIEHCVHAFSSFYFHCLHSGLRAEGFDAHTQTRLFSSLMEHFLLEKKETAGGKH
jgi:AcrR family transcriptional regulator